MDEKWLMPKVMMSILTFSNDTQATNKITIKMT